MTDAEAEVPKLVQPSPRCYVRQEVDNIGWIVGTDGILVVDALEQADLEEEILRCLAETGGGQSVVAVVNTHTHYDHVALNPVFEKRFDAEIVNARTREVPETGLALDPGGAPVWILPMPGCHTAEDVVVWFPAEKIVFIGDIFGWGLIPWDRPLDREKLDHILATYQRIIDLEPKVVVPGHGPLCSCAELRRWQRYVTDLVAGVESLYSEGMSRRDIPVDRLPPPEDMADWWRFLKWKHEDSVKKVSHAVARGRL